MNGTRHTWALQDPNELSIAVPNAAPLPALSEPTALPPVNVPVAEPLVRLEHRRIRSLEVYWHSGWQHAVAQTFVRQSVADRLGAVVDALPRPWGLAVCDGWRPLALQKEIYDAAYSDPALPPGFVSKPVADPVEPPPHLTGGVVDISLSWGQIPLALGTGFDDFTPDAHASAFEDRPGLIRDLRRFLFEVMSSAGFVVIDCEWWHFEFGTRRWAALTGVEPLYGPASALLN